MDSFRARRPLLIGLSFALLVGLAQVSRPERSARLPVEWRSLSPIAFERAVDELAAGTFSDEDLRDLQAALDEQDAAAVRAAALLAACGNRDAAGVILIARLERREPAPSRGRDAGDIVAAAALADRGRDLPERLAELAVGSAPHPDLEVRVECARAALASGRTNVVPFLLRVLRAATPEEAGIDWEPTQTMAWSKSRAAEALSARAGVPCVFRPDGSYAHQLTEASRLEALLRP